MGILCTIKSMKDFRRYTLCLICWQPILILRVFPYSPVIKGDLLHTRQHISYFMGSVRLVPSIPVSYTHLDVYKRQGVNSEKVFKNTSNNRKSIESNVWKERSNSNGYKQAVEIPIRMIDTPHLPTANYEPYFTRNYCILRKYKVIFHLILIP